MKLFYVPQQQQLGGHTEYLSGPNGIFELQAKELGVAIASIRPHGHILPPPDGKFQLLQQVMWEAEQTKQLLNMFEHGFIGKQDVVFLENSEHTGEGILVQALGLYDRQTTRIVTDNYGLIFSRRFRDLVGFSNFEPGTGEERRLEVLYFNELSDAWDTGLMFFMALADSVLRERNDVKFSILRTSTNEYDSRLRIRLNSMPADSLSVATVTRAAERADRFSMATVLLATDRSLATEYKLLEAAAMGCAPLYADASYSALSGHLSGLAASQTLSYKFPDVLSAKIKLYSVFGGPTQRFDWLCLAAEKSVQRLLHDAGFDVPAVYFPTDTIGHKLDEQN